MILVLTVAMYLYQQQKKEILSLRPSFFWKQILIISAHVGSRLIFFLSVVGNFLLILSVVSNIFRPLSLVGNVNPIHTLIEAIALTILISSDISLLAPMHISFPFSHLLSPFEMAFPTVCC